MQELKIELFDVEAARALRSWLRSHGLEADEGADGPGFVAVDLSARDPEQRVETVLSIVDRWLERTRVGPVTVHLDGSKYVLGHAAERR